MKLLERAQNGLFALLSLLAFGALAGTLLGLALVLCTQAVRAPHDPWLLRTLQESLLVSLGALPPALLFGAFVALYWVEFREERLAVLGRGFAREMAKLPDLFVAVAIVALVRDEQRSSRALLVFAVFVPALVFVATSTTTLLTRIVPLYRASALALGVPRHRWIMSAVSRIALRPMAGIGILAFGRILTATAPLLVLAPTNRNAPLPLALLRASGTPSLALYALLLLAIVLVTKSAGRAMLGAEPESRFE